MKSKYLHLLSQELFFGSLKTANSVSVSLLGDTLIKEIKQLFFYKKQCLLFSFYLRYLKTYKKINFRGSVQ